MHDEIQSVIRDVRRRWRLKLALRGLTWVVGAAAITLFVASLGMERLGFTPQSIVIARVIAYVAILGAAAIFLLRPLVRRVPDPRVALYLEEHEPTLDAALVSAVEHGDAGTGRTPQSEPLAKAVVASAVSRLQAVDRGRRVERPELRRRSIILASLVVGVIVVLLVGPAFLRHGARAVFAPWRTADAAMPYNVQVVPGDTTIPRGGDLEVHARLGGFDAEEVTLVATRGTSEPERIAMPRGADSAQFTIRLFDLDQQTEYYVEAGPVRSPAFRISVADLPSVKRIDLE